MRIGTGPPGAATVPSSMLPTSASEPGARRPTVMARKPARADSGEPLASDGEPLAAIMSSTDASTGSSGTRGWPAATTASISTIESVFASVSTESGRESAGKSVAILRARE